MKDRSLTAFIVLTQEGLFIITPKIYLKNKRISYITKLFVEVVRLLELSEQDGELRGIQGYDVRKILRDKAGMWRVTALAKILLTKLANIKKPMDVSEEEFVRGEFSMCKAFEDMREEGKAEGKVEERENGICSVLHVVKKFHGSKEQAVTTLMEEYTLSEEAAIKKLELYW